MITLYMMSTYLPVVSVFKTRPTKGRPRVATGQYQSRLYWYILYLSIYLSSVCHVDPFLKRYIYVHIFEIIYMKKFIRKK